MFRLFSIRSMWLAAVLSCCFIATNSALASNDDDRPERLIIFGDSLSDAGNYFIATGQSVSAPFEPIPDAPYAFHNRFRFSNGRTWIEQLAGDWDIESSAKPALKKPGKFTNYAFGRARARSGAGAFPMIDLSDQRERFLTDFGWAVPADATYVIWIGANDLQDGLGALQIDSSGVLTTQILTDALTAIGNHIFLLQQYGARKFLVLNLPDLSITPAVSGLPDPIPGIAQGLAFSFNNNLAATLDGLEATLGVQIARLDIFTLLNTVVASPQAFGFRNVIDSCLTFFVAEDFLCKKPNRYLFFDAIHPTVRGHKVVARAVEDLLDVDDDSDSDDD